MRQDIIAENGLELTGGDERMMWLYNHVPSLVIVGVVVFLTIATYLLIRRRKRAKLAIVKQGEDAPKSKLTSRRELIDEAASRRECSVINCVHRVTDEMHIPIERATGLRGTLIRFLGGTPPRAYRVGTDPTHPVCELCKQDSLIEADLWIANESHAQMQTELERASRRALFARVEMYEKLCEKQRQRAQKAKDFRTEKPKIEDVSNVISMARVSSDGNGG